MVIILLLLFIVIAVILLEVIVVRIVATLPKREVYIVNRLITNLLYSIRIENIAALSGNKDQ